MKRRLLQISVGIVLGVAISALLLYPSIQEERTRVQEEEMGFLLSPLPTPSFALTTQRGEPFSSDELHGRVSFVFFGFTNCPDVCPVTLMNLTRALETIPEGSTRVQGVMISVDPERDTPERLSRYMQAFDSSFIALTGEEAEIRAAATGFGVFFRSDHPVGTGADAAAPADAAITDAADPGDPGAPRNPTGHADHTDHEISLEDTPEVGVDVGGYSVEHTARSYVLDEEGRIVLTFPPFATSEQIARALSHLLSS